MSVITATPDSKRIKLASGSSTRKMSPWNLNGSYSEPRIAFEINCKSNLLPKLNLVTIFSIFVALFVLILGSISLTDDFNLAIISFPS